MLPELSTKLPSGTPQELSKWLTSSISLRRSVRLKYCAEKIDPLSESAKRIVDLVSSAMGIFGIDRFSIIETGLEIRSQNQILPR